MQVELNRDEAFAVHYFVNEELENIERDIKAGQACAMNTSELLEYRNLLKGIKDKLETSDHGNYLQ